MYTYFCLAVKVNFRQTYKRQYTLTVIYIFHDIKTRTVSERWKAVYVTDGYLRVFFLNFNLLNFILLNIILPIVKSNIFLNSLRT